MVMMVPLYQALKEIKGLVWHHHVTLASVTFYTELIAPSHQLISELCGSKKGKNLLYFLTHEQSRNRWLSLLPSCHTIKAAGRNSNQFKINYQQIISYFWHQMNISLGVTEVHVWSWPILLQ
jgi:hypothetical protein